MEKEEVFRAALDKTVEVARRNRNTITKEGLEKIFSGLSFDEEQMVMIETYLSQKNIKIGEPEEEELPPDDRTFLQMYLDDLKELPSRTQEEKSTALNLAIEGDEAAKKQIVNDFLPEVVEIAKLYTGQGISLEDLIGEGNIGLMMGIEMLSCIEKEKEKEGYLGKMIMDAMDSAIAANQADQAFDEKMLEKIERIRMTAEELSSDLRRAVSIRELADEMKMSEEEIDQAISYTGNRIDGIEGFTDGVS